MKSIEETILEIVRQLTQNADVTLETAVLDEGIMDSLTTIELITKLEGEYNIFIDSEDLNHHNFNTVQNMSELISKKTAK